MTHVCVSKLTIIGSDNGLAPGRRQPIIWTNAGILLIRTNFSEILSEIRAFSFKKMHLKMSSAKWRPFCLGLNMLIITDFGSMRCLNPYIQSDNSSSSWCYLLYLYPTLNKIYLILSYIRQCFSWWRHQMEPFSTLLALCAGNSPVTGEFPSQRPVTRSFRAFFDLCLKKPVEQTIATWWFEAQTRSLWCHCNVHGQQSKDRPGASEVILEYMGKIDRAEITTKHDTTQTVGIFYWFYCSLINMINNWWRHFQRKGII